MPIEQNGITIAGEVVYRDHHLLVFKQRDRRWMCSCSCGYRSAYRITEDAAAEAAVHHVYKVMEKDRANGTEVN